VRLLRSDARAGCGQLRPACPGDYRRAICKRPGQGRGTSLSASSLL